MSEELLRALSSEQRAVLWVGRGAEYEIHAGYHKENAQLRAQEGAEGEGWKLWHVDGRPRPRAVVAATARL
jgi:hypothetical protein